MERMKQLSDIDGDYWLQFRANESKPVAALAELLDNCLDAGASSVSVEYDPDKKLLRVTDNGCGMDEEGLQKMFRLGGSTKKADAKKSGRYGHGSKVGMAYWGSVFDIVSVKDGVMTRLLWDTDKDVASGEWKAGLRSPSVKKTSKPNGTTITITRLHKHRRMTERVWNDLRWEMTPAMAQCGFTFNGIPQEETKIPWREAPALKHGEVDGQRLTLEVGRLKEGASRPKHVHCVRLNRFVPDLCDWSDPVGGTTLCVAVRLHVRKKSDWTLDSLKQSLADETLRERLEQEIRRLCSDEIAQFKQEDQERACRLLEGRLNSLASGRFEIGDEVGLVSGGPGGDVKIDLDPDRDIIRRPGKGREDQLGAKTHRRLEGKTGALRFQFVPLEDDFTTVHYDRGERCMVVSFNTESPAYEAQRPNHAMYFALAGQAIAAKMVDDSMFVGLLKGWKEHMEERGLDMETRNIESKFCLWFQHQAASEPELSGTTSAA